MLNKLLDASMLLIAIFFPVVTAKGYVSYFILLTLFNVLCFIRHYRAKMYLYSLQPIATEIMGILGFFVKY